VFLFLGFFSKIFVLFFLFSFWACSFFFYGGVCFCCFVVFFFGWCEFLFDVEELFGGDWFFLLGGLFGGIFVRFFWGGLLLGS